MPHLTGIQVIPVHCTAVQLLQLLPHLPHLPHLLHLLPLQELLKNAIFLQQQLKYEQARNKSRGKESSIYQVFLEGLSSFLENTESFNLKVLPTHLINHSLLCSGSLRT